MAEKYQYCPECSSDTVRDGEKIRYREDGQSRSLRSSNANR